MNKKSIKHFPAIGEATLSGVIVDCNIETGLAKNVESYIFGGQLKNTHKVLELGTGSGYQTAILSFLSRRVYTIERIKSLLTKAETIFENLKISNIVCKHGDGNLGWPEQIPLLGLNKIPLLGQKNPLLGLKSVLYLA